MGQANDTSTEVLPLMPDPDTELAPIEAAEPAPPPPITWKYLPSGMPIVIGDVDDVVDRVRAEFTWPIWYLVAHKRTFTRWKGGWINNQHYPEQDIPEDQPKIFKVIDNIIGMSIHEAPPEDVGMAPVQQKAEFHLPKIPWPVIQKLDNFFRSVDQRYHTEAIVILTWNPKVGGSDGWGVVVPKQENTAGHCKYDGDSIVDDKDDDAFVVGSAHSHPGMSAYASGVDHHDQADFDGLHITFGWQNTVNQGATQFHAEMQMGGKAWKLEPTAIFLDIPEEDRFPEVKKWQDRVSKQAVTTPATTQTGSRAATTTGPSNVGEFTRTPAYGENFGYLNMQSDAAKTFTPPTGFPDPKDVLIVAVIAKDATTCPTCAFALDDKALDFRRCHHCWNFIAQPGETLEDIATIRGDLGVDLWDLGPKNTKKKIAWVVREGNTVVTEEMDSLMGPALSPITEGTEVPLTKP